MTFMFRKAVREKTSLLIGIAGASGSGKTFSALKLATGLAGPKGRIAALDTEAGRMLHYADQFAFDHCDLTPPFTPARYAEAITAAEEAGYDVIIVDSMTHEYEGVGGIVEWAAQIEAGGTKSPGNWKVPKTEHKKMVARLLQCRAHLVFCFRADEKIRIEKVEENGRTKTVVVPIGWVPITEKRFLYELTTSILMVPEKPGEPIPVKIQDQHRHCFSITPKVGEDTGRLLSAWAHGGEAPTESSILAAARRSAAEGSENFRGYWKRLDQAERVIVKTILDELQRTAAKADADAEDPMSMGVGKTADGSAAASATKPETEADPSTEQTDGDLPDDETLLEKARAKAMEGGNAWAAWRDKLTIDEQAELAPHMAGLDSAAARADGGAR